MYLLCFALNSFVRHCGKGTYLPLLLWLSNLTLIKFGSLSCSVNNAGEEVNVQITATHNSQIPPWLMWVKSVRSLISV